MNKIDSSGPLKVIVIARDGVEADKRKELALLSRQQLRKIKTGLSTEDIEVTFDSMRAVRFTEDDMCVMLTPHDLNPPKSYKT